MVGTTIGGTSQDAKLRLRELSRGINATFMISPQKDRCVASIAQNANARRMRYCADLAPLARRTEISLNRRFWIAFNQAADVICLFLVGSPASHSKLGCQAPGCKGGSNNMRSYLLAVWATARFFQWPSASISSAIPPRAQNMRVFAVFSGTPMIFATSAIDLS
jgi:hypothetical protein